MIKLHLQFGNLNSLNLTSPVSGGEFLSVKKVWIEKQFDINQSNKKL